MARLTRALSAFCFCSTVVFSQSLQPLVLTKSFVDLAIKVGGTTTLFFNVMNPNTVAATNGSFTGTLPAGLVFMNSREHTAPFAAAGV